MTKTPLPLGYRFHPLDFELIECLKRILKGEQSEGIANVNIYKFDPWDLPAKSCSTTKDLAWYFFCLLEKKYPNGDRMKRDTKSGFWKTTGNDRAIPHKGKTVGVVKTLIFHTGRAPRGARTDWFMHEYKLKDKDAHVICKVFKRSVAGPRNGPHYGALLDEEECSVDEELGGVEAFPLACVSAPASALQTSQENSVMTSTFTPTNICIGSSSELTSFKSVQPTENISTPVFGNDFSLYEGLGLSLDDLDLPPGASAHDNYASEENSIMASTLKPGNICIGSSSESNPFKSVQPTDNISRPVACEYFSIYECPSFSLDDLDSPPIASAHDDYGRENLYDGDYEGFPNFQSCYSGNQLREYGMSLSDLPPEEETQNMAEDFQTYANHQELGTLSKKRKYTGYIEDVFQNSLQEND